MNIPQMMAGHPEAVLSKDPATVAGMPGRVWAACWISILKTAFPMSRPKGTEVSLSDTQLCV